MNMAESMAVGHFVPLSLTEITFNKFSTSLFKDFDNVLLEKYTVKVLHIIHVCSLGSTLFTSV